MKTLAEKKQDSKRYVRHSMEIALFVKKQIEEKSLNKNTFAEQVGVNATEVSKWLSGTQNFTLRTITKIENVLGADIIRNFERNELGLKEKQAIPLINNKGGRLIVHDFLAQDSSDNETVESLELDEVIGY